jgi:hypothetical protein
LNAGFRPHASTAACALGFAELATLGVVFELFVVEKDLLAGREHEVRATVNTLQHAISKFHGLYLKEEKN